MHVYDVERLQKLIGKFAPNVDKIYTPNVVLSVELSQTVATYSVPNVGIQKKASSVQSVKRLIFAASVANAIPLSML